MLDEGGVTLIEWGDAIVPALPADYLEVRIDLRRRRRRPRSSSSTPVGPRWAARARAIVDGARWPAWTDGEGTRPC